MENHPEILGSFSCTEINCGISFSDRDALNNHLKSCHNYYIDGDDKVIPVTSSPDEKERDKKVNNAKTLENIYHKCEHCQKFIGRNYLRSHRIQYRRNAKKGRINYKKTERTSEKVVVIKGEK